MCSICKGLKVEYIQIFDQHSNKYESSFFYKPSRFTVNNLTSANNFNIPRKAPKQWNKSKFPTIFHIATDNPSLKSKVFISIQNANIFNLCAMLLSHWSLVACNRFTRQICDVRKSLVLFRRSQIMGVVGIEVFILDATTEKILFLKHLFHSSFLRFWYNGQLKKKHFNLKRGIQF